MFIKSPMLKKWYMMRAREMDPVWEDKEEFFRWCRETGYMPGDKLCRCDTDMPFGPENCYWLSPSGQKKAVPTDMRADVIRKWNRTVNVIRRHFGFTPFKED